MGRTVIYRQPSRERPYNGCREHPAIINVWADGEVPAVNLTVFFDCGPVECRTSVPHDERALPADACWRWPERVPG